MFGKALQHIFSIITLPGIIVHEISHKFFCDIFDIPVKQVKYFIPFADITSSTTAQLPKRFMTSYWIAIAPLIINSIVCVLFTLPYSIMFYYGTEFVSSTSRLFNICNGILLWVGLSIGWHAIPSRSDLSNVIGSDESRSKKITLTTTKLLLYPFNSTGFFGRVFRLFYTSFLLRIVPILFF
ncbi:hypothetical protein Noda2021_05660 [Candidatus Dependentiae bacterium Noda2021]|nr:hypothetical protein Noda2021_05660 [Candidatus Dependentiae bacterium Noda2021]